MTGDTASESSVASAQRIYFTNHALHRSSHAALCTSAESSGTFRRVPAPVTLTPPNSWFTYGYKDEIRVHCMTSMHRIGRTAGLAFTCMSLACDHNGTPAPPRRNTELDTGACFRTRIRHGGHTIARTRPVTNATGRGYSCSESTLAASPCTLHRPAGTICAGSALMLVTRSPAKPVRRRSCVPLLARGSLRSKTLMLLLQVSEPPAPGPKCSCQSR